MSPLQLWLLVIGAAILVGVIAYNAWSTRRGAPRRARRETSSAHAGDGPEDPRLDGADEGLGAPLASRIDPMLDADAEWAPPVPAEKPPGLDLLIDAVAPIALDGRVVSGEALLAALPATRRVGSKPFGVEAQPEGSSDWEYPVAGRRYGAVQVGVQLANRTGALNEIEFSEFVGVAQRYADAIDGEPDFPDMAAEVARARELDQFASQNDGQLAFSLRARGAAWSPGFIAQQAARLGFVAGAVPGRMVLPAAQSGLPPILALGFEDRDAGAGLADAAAVREIVLHLDVPQVPRAELAFDRLCEAAQTLAQGMDGVLTDAAGQALGEATMDMIRVELERRYASLQERDLAAGSPQARRLFS